MTHRMMKIIKNKIFIAFISAACGFGLVVGGIVMYRMLGFEDFLKTFIFFLIGVLFSGAIYGSIMMFIDLSKDKDD